MYDKYMMISSPLSNMPILHEKQLTAVRPGQCSTARPPLFKAREHEHKKKDDKRTHTLFVLFLKKKRRPYYNKSNQLLREQFD